MEVVLSCDPTSIPGNLFPPLEKFCLASRNVGNVHDPSFTSLLAEAILEDGTTVDRPPSGFGSVELG